ncbi:MAG TPA: DedA family protein [Candidatus Dormibacteraeota bacterium]|jgi:membrane protein DedA with SNARE-associated domain|nr:DedA family protein [Candidatus Dormibacteraeota bacterium]
MGVGKYLRQASPITRGLIHLILAHKALSTFAVIALEEIGVPLPLPGDVVIMFAGHLVARGRLSPLTAFLAVVLGSMAGSSVLFWLSRRFGQPFVKRYGPYMHVRPDRLARAERGFKRWGVLLIVVGRHIPGMRMVISVFAGVFGVSYPVFLASVAVSAAAWAGMFLALGYALDNRIGQYMTITPLHLLPSTLCISGSIIYGVILHRRALAAERRATATSLSPGVA